MKDYKIAINQRVIEVIKKLQNDYTSMEIAQIIGVKPAKLSEIMASRMAAGLDVISGLCVNFSISPDYILIGIGGMIRGDLPMQDDSRATIDRLNRIIDTQQKYIASLETDIDNERKKTASLLGQTNTVPTLH